MPSVANIDGKKTLTSTINISKTSTNGKSIRNMFELLIILLTLAYKWAISLNSYSGFCY